jgi:hypothetical protein
MEMDEWIFSLLAAINGKWTSHTEDGTIDEMQEEIRKLREIVQKMQERQAAVAVTTSDLQYKVVTNPGQIEQVDEITMPMPNDAKQNIQEPQPQPQAAVIVI